MRRDTRTGVTAVVVAVAVLAAGFVVRPAPPDLSAEVTGDTGLAERALPLLEDGPRATAAVVEVDGDSVREAYFGADETTLYEIGSVSKSLTGLLLAEAIERGEVEEDTELGALLDLKGAPASTVTLAELSSHRSGLPRNPPGAANSVTMLLDNLRNRDPYTGDLDTLLDSAAGADLTDRGEFAYSNLGAALLGQALAASAGTDYETLLRQRVLVPLGMESTVVPAAPDDVPAEAAVGYGTNGRPFSPSANAAWAPMGGVYSTGGDMGLLVRALLEGEVPGVEALEPRWDDGRGSGIGLGWFVTDHDGTEVTWHNGMTGGFAAMVALDREGGRAVLVLADSAVAVDSVALDLLLEKA
ncbi:serine hydrolase domain-containing protein [Nocardiopsis prasina]|uniref:serine hydrolase domain-containing protein n=1 Tax=Nocardiopsis prasina TaxID=2015 RepID=UPI0003712CC9|nr:serine hydrolase domain-containing protein [Nocardiopsis prasina]